MNETRARWTNARGGRKAAVLGVIAFAWLVAGCGGRASIDDRRLITDSDAGVERPLGLLDPSAAAADPPQMAGPPTQGQTPPAMVPGQPPTNVEPPGMAPPMTDEQPPDMPPMSAPPAMTTPPAKPPPMTMPPVMTPPVMTPPGQPPMMGPPPPPPQNMPPIGTTAPPPPDQPPPDQPPPDVPPDEVPDLSMLPEGCTLETGSSGRDSCEQQVQCDDGQWAWVYCGVNTSSSNYCYCEGARNFLELQVEGADLQRSCELAASACVLQDPPSGITSLDCSDQYEDSQAEWCNVERQCSYGIELEDGAKVSTLTWESSWCNLDRGGDWTCQCNVPSNYVELSLPGTADPDTLCSDVIDYCSSNAEVSDEITTCSVDSQSASREWCDARVACERSTTVAGQPAAVLEFSDMYCSHEGNGVWDCYCSNTGENFAMTGDDSWDLCTEAAEICASFGG